MLPLARVGSARTRRDVERSMNWRNIGAGRDGGDDRADAAMTAMRSHSCQGLSAFLLRTSSPPTNSIEERFPNDTSRMCACDVRGISSPSTPRTDGSSSRSVRDDSRPARRKQDRWRPAAAPKFARYQPGAFESH